MADAVAVITLNTDMADLWSFMQDVDRWAPLFQGYKEHEQTGADEYRWRVTGKVGMISRTVDLKVVVTRFEPPSLVEFTLAGITENISGTGLLRAVRQEPGDGVELTFRLNMKAGGAVGPMINAHLKPALKSMTEHLLHGIQQEIESNRRLC
ncbi:MAG: SRPBCC family protein [Thermaerobacterales bacterium]